MSEESERASYHDVTLSVRVQSGDVAGAVEVVKACWNVPDHLFADHPTIDAVERVKDD